VFDQDALHASLDLVRRSGASTIEFGYLDEDVPVEEARWWASAEYRGIKISVEDHRGPIEADAEREEVGARLWPARRPFDPGARPESELMADPTVCKCGHRIYTHGRWREPGSGNWVYSRCSAPDCPCSKWKASDGSGWPPS
jgi:hypothetical protein